ncbi:MAG: hypothetical protein U0269_14710 [Polyangiales bacterium]
MRRRAHLVLLLLLAASSLQPDLTLDTLGMGLWAALLLTSVAQLAIDARAYRTLEKLGAVAITRPAIDRQRAGSRSSP